MRRSRYLSLFLLNLINCFNPGLRVAEVRVIFTLPAQFGHSSRPLAYIHWFTPLHTWNDKLGMYQLSRSTRRGGHPNAAIVFADQIVRSCHLLPKFGSGPVPRAWLKGRVLDLAPTFYLNRYIDFFAFEDLKPGD